MFWLNSKAEAYTLEGEPLPASVMHRLHIPTRKSSAVVSGALANRPATEEFLVHGNAPAPTSMAESDNYLREVIEAVSEAFGDQWPAAVFGLLSPLTLAVGRHQNVDGGFGRHIFVLYSPEPGSGKTLLMQLQAVLLGRSKFTVTSGKELKQATTHVSCEVLC
jgi:hypothetical protein